MKKKLPPSDNKAEIESLKDTIVVLEGICKAFSFILPPHVSNPSECVTTTELYRVQAKMAKNMWVSYINAKSK